MPTTIKTTDLQPSRIDEAPVPAPAGSEPCLDDRELRAWRGLLRAHAALTKALDNQLEAGHGLPLMSYEVLMQLADADDRRMRMRDLASSVILSRSGLTRLVDRLEADGLLRRESCSSDARGAFAVLTDTGQREAPRRALDAPRRRALDVPRALRRRRARQRSATRGSASSRAPRAPPVPAAPDSAHARRSVTPEPPPSRRSRIGGGVWCRRCNCASSAWGRRAQALARHGSPAPAADARAPRRAFRYSDLTGIH